MRNPPRSRDLGQGFASGPGFLVDAHAVRACVLQLAHVEAHRLLAEEQRRLGDSLR
jgi:hypothetical protein